MPGIGIGVGLGAGGGSGLSEAEITLALARRGLSDAQARAAVGGAVSVAAGLRAIGLTVAGAGTPKPIPAPTPSATSLPAGVVARWDAGSLVGLADGAGIASWTDSAGNAAVTQGNPALRPVFKSAGQGGKPYVLLGGGQYLNGAPGSPASNAFASGTHTTLCVIRNVQPAFGRIVNGRQSNDYPCVSANGGGAGGKDTLLPFASSAFAVIGTCIRADEGQGRPIVNGTIGYRNDYRGNANPTAGDYLSIGGAAYYDVSARCELYEVIVWDRVLTQVDLLQATKALFDRYGLAYPWAGGPFRLFDGDSLLCNYNGSGGAPNAVPQRVAAAKGGGTAPIRRPPGSVRPWPT